VHHPKNIFYYDQGDLFDLAAAYCIHIAQAQAFLDGNKRTGAAAAIVFLDANGYPITGDSMRIHEGLIAVATGEMDRSGSLLLPGWPLQRQPDQDQATPVGDGADNLMHQQILVHHVGRQQHDDDDAQDIEAKADHQARDHVECGVENTHATVERQQQADQQAGKDDAEAVAFGGDMEGVLLHPQDQLGWLAGSTHEAEFDAFADTFQCPGAPFSRQPAQRPVERLHRNTE